MFNLIRKIWLASITLLVCVMFFCFLLYLNLNPIDLGVFFGSKISFATGLTVNQASVAENPINKLALELSNKEKELNRYEDILTEREMNIVKESNIFNNRLLLVLIFIVIILLILVSFNFYFDHKRFKKTNNLSKDNASAKSFN